MVRNGRLRLGPQIHCTYLMEQLGLTGAKAGCENGDCGACTVLVDGWPIKSCLMLAVEAVGHSVTTIEGLKNAPTQKAFLKIGDFNVVIVHPDLS